MCYVILIIVFVLVYYAPEFEITEWNGLTVKHNKHTRGDGNTRDQTGLETGNCDDSHDLWDPLHMVSSLVVRNVSLKWLFEIP